jgi:hypothetical protein
MELPVKPEILMSCIYISYPVAQLCVNTLLATKVILITDGIEFGTLRVKNSVSCFVYVILAMRFKSAK